MLIYRAHVSSFSPWPADTLFAQVCRVIYTDQGQAALDSFLRLYYEGQPPLIFSNTFPLDLLPRPLLPLKPAADRSKSAQVAAMERERSWQRREWLNLADFNLLRAGREIDLESPDRSPGDGDKPATSLELVVYVKAVDASWAEEVESWLGQLGGTEQFSLQRWERFTLFDRLSGEPNAFISLSNWVPAAEDPTNGYYRTLVSYGRPDGEQAERRPLLMLQAGSLFYTLTPEREWYGRLVSGVNPDRPGAVRHGYAFALPVRIAGGR